MMIYQYWIYYFLFIKKIYSGRSKEINYSVIALSAGCLTFNLIFIAIILEIYWDFKGFLYLINTDLPLGPMGYFLALLILIPISIAFNQIKLKNKYSIYRKAINKTRNLSKLYTVFYVIFSGILWILGILLSIFSDYL